MAEVTINYKDTAIATMDASGTKTLQTQGKYCEDDIEVVYARPSAPSGTKQINITQNGTTLEDVAAYAIAEIIANVPTGGSDVESGTYTPTERTKSHSITTQADKSNFVVFAGEGFDYSLGSAAMILYLYGGYGIGTNNAGTSTSTISSSQGSMTKSGNTFTYESGGTLSSTSRCWQANVTYHWFAW